MKKLLVLAMVAGSLAFAACNKKKAEAPRDSTATNSGAPATQQPMEQQPATTDTAHAAPQAH